MAGKFYGAIGYVETVETVPGVHEPRITEKKYRGEIIEVASRWRESENLNPNLVLENRLSIIADQHAYNNFQSIRYVQWLGAKWMVTSVKVSRPRLILTIGGVYNDQSTTTSPIP